MGQRRAGQLTPPSRNYRPLSTTVSEESYRFAGQTPSVTLTCGRKHANTVAYPEGAMGPIPISGKKDGGERWTMQ